MYVKSICDTSPLSDTHIKYFLTIYHLFFIFSVIYFENTTAWISKIICSVKKSVHCMIPCMCNSRIGNTNPQWWKSHPCKMTQGNSGGWKKCSISWLWSWLQAYIYLSKLTELYTYSGCILLYINYITITLKKFHYKHQRK